MTPYRVGHLSLLLLALCAGGSFAREPAAAGAVAVREITVTQTGGDPEPMPPTVRVRMDGADGASPSFVAPRHPGAYRLFVYVHDGSGSAGHANIPFHVSPPDTVPPAAMEAKT